MTAASPFPLSPDPRLPARLGILLALALHAAVPLTLVAAPLLAPPRVVAVPPEIIVEMAELPPDEAAPAPAALQPPDEQPPAPPPGRALLLDPPMPMLEPAPIGDVSRAAPGPDAEPAPSPPAQAEPMQDMPMQDEPTRAGPARPEAPTAEAEAAPVVVAPPAAAPATLPEPPRQDAKPPEQQPRQQVQRPAERPADRKPPARPPEAGKARVDGPATGGRGRDAQRSASASEARQQSEGDFVLAQIMPLWLIDRRSPRFRDVVMSGVFALQEDGTLAPPYGKNDPWRPEVMIENYRELLKPQAEPVRVALESFLRAARDAQPFQLPPGVRGYPRPIRITLKMGDR